MDDEEDLADLASFMKDRGYEAVKPTEGFEGFRLFHYGCGGRIYKIKPGISKSELAQCTKCFRTGPIALALDEDGQLILTNGDTGFEQVLFENEEVVDSDSETID